MKHYVYELRNSENQVEYVGYTTKPKSRLYQHTRVLPGHNGSGKFYGRTDIILNIVHETHDKREATELEGKLKISHGFDWTERGCYSAIENRSRKLTHDQAIEIRSKYVPRKYTMMKLAKEYNVSYKTVHQIIKEQTYK